MKTADWIALAGVIATLLIAFTAIWGDRIRAWLFKPQLRVTIENPRGESTSETVFPDVRKEYNYTRPARYYRLVATNARRLSIAHDVRILITRLETPDPSGVGVPISVWTGELPLMWLHSQVYPVSRNLGPPAIADFVVVAHDPV